MSAEGHATESLSAAARPDPDALLARVDAEASQARRGRLRIFFGASAGVGKTYAMLAAARRRQTSGGAVLAGVVETHGRPETAELLAGLPRLPARRTEHQGQWLEDFDLDGALARRPPLILVDELAHSNAPGARHPKRWQDVEELLAAGIDVDTTVNVQHLESLNDVVGGITGIRVRETVPDRIFDRADRIVLVDIPPEELLQRLAEGRIYLPDQAERAIRNFFRRGNLIALRELALRRTAERVDTEMLALRRGHPGEPVWATRGAVLACVGPGPGGAAVVRAAARLSTGAPEGAWHAVQVRQAGDSTQDASALALARSLGAQVHRITAGDVAAALAAHARAHNLPRLVLGRRSPGGALPALLRRLRPDLGERLASLAPELELTRVGLLGPTLPPSHGPSASPGSNPDSRPAARPAPGVATSATPAAAGRSAAGLVGAAVACALATLLAALLPTSVDLTNVAMLFVLAVIGVAATLGRGPALLATFLSVALFDFCFVPPRLSFAVSDVRYLLTFGVLLAVGLIAGQLTAGLRQQARAADARERSVASLYALARELSGALLPAQIEESVDRFCHQALGQRARLLTLDESGRVVLPADAPPEVDAAIAQWALDHGQAAGQGTDTLALARARYLPLAAPQRARGVLALVPGTPGSRPDPEAEATEQAVAGLAAVALERQHFVAVAQSATVQIESERLRNSVLSALSHDLRTPLGALVGLAESLRLSGLSGDERASLHEALKAQAGRLVGLVDNLLDMARLQAGGLALRRAWVPLEEVIGASLAPLGAQMDEHPLHLDLPEDLPPADVDPVLFERVLGNLLENAAKYTPPSCTVTLRARHEAGKLRITVEDQGPGLPPGREEALFDKFTRGNAEDSIPGVGLGLAICRAIVQAHGGTIHASQRPGGGARFTIELPQGRAPEGPA
jgi:two-component system sensor histidine kinase KdpD